MFPGLVSNNQQVSLPCISAQPCVVRKKWLETSLKIIGIVGLIGSGMLMLGLPGAGVTGTAFAAIGLHSICAAAFLSAFSLLAGLKGRAMIASASARFDYILSCLERILVFWETRDVCEYRSIPVSKIYYNKNDWQHEVNSYHSNQNAETLWDKESQGNWRPLAPIPFPYQRSIFNTVAVQEKRDALTVATDLLRFYESSGKGADEGVAVVNLTDRCHPGGNAHWGSPGHEEDLMRRTNYERSLKSIVCPFPHYGIVYASDVFILRDTEATGYKFLENSKKINVVSAEVFQNVMDGRQIEGAKRKIRAILRTAFHEGNRDLVLGPLNCRSTELFKEVLLGEPEFVGAFRRVVFC